MVWIVSPSVKLAVWLRSTFLQLLIVAVVGFWQNIINIKCVDRNSWLLSHHESYVDIYDLLLSSYLILYYYNLPNIINNVINNNFYYIKDSFISRNWIKNITIPNNYLIFYLDILSLYINIPEELTIITLITSGIISSNLLPFPNKNSPNLVLKTNYFQYKQNF